MFNLYCWKNTAKNLNYSIIQFGCIKKKEKKQFQFYCQIKKKNERKIVFNKRDCQGWNSYRLKIIIIMYRCDAQRKGCNHLLFAINNVYVVRYS